MLVMCVGDGEVHVVCVWRYINERWSRWLYENQLTGPIPSELGQLTLTDLYVLFTPPSFHAALARSVLPLLRAVPPFDVLFLSSSVFFVSLIVFVSTFLSAASISLVSFEELERRAERVTSPRWRCVSIYRRDDGGGGGVCSQCWPS